MYQDRYNLILKHMSEVYFRKGSIEQLKQYDNAKITGWWHDALAYYRMNDFHLSLEEVKAIPNPYYGYTAYIRKKGMSEQWIYYDEWVYVGDVDDSVFL